MDAVKRAYRKGAGNKDFYPVTFFAEILYQSVENRLFENTKKGRMLKTGEYKIPPYKGFPTRQ